VAYDRTKTEKAALGLIDEDHFVPCGALEVPYLAFRKSELTRINDCVADPEKIMDVIYDVCNYRYKGTLPREDFDEFVTLEHAMAFLIDNRGGQKKAVSPEGREATKAASKPTSEPTTPTSSTTSPAS
jgi:hypothetical protein